MATVTLERQDSAAAAVERFQRLLPANHTALCHLSANRFLVAKSVHTKKLVIEPWIRVQSDRFRPLAIGETGERHYAKAEEARQARQGAETTVPVSELEALIEKLSAVKRQIAKR